MYASLFQCINTKCEAIHPINLLSDHTDKVMQTPRKNNIYVKISSHVVAYIKSKQFMDVKSIHSDQKKV